MRILTFNRWRLWWSSHANRVYPILIWVLLFTFYEHIDPYIAISHCSFPQLPILEQTGGNWDPSVIEQLTDGAPISKLGSTSSGFPPNTGSSASKNLPQTNVLIIADPQLIDGHTYPDMSRGFLSLAQLTVDNYIYKNYRALLKNLQPHMVVFLGDLLDDGRSPPSDEYYETQYERFLELFVIPTLEHQGKRNKNNIQVITNVPGNHDIGYGNGITKESIKRFESHFGPRNLVIDKPSHQLIFLNDLLISNGEIKEELTPFLNEDMEFISNIASQKKVKTRILFDHVTLWKDSDAGYCGPRRESKSGFPITRGHQYQTVLDESTSDMLLKKIIPDIIFSGDDHDFCEIVDEYIDDQEKSHKTISINVKSMSMAMGIFQPSVHLLTLYDEPASIAHDFVIRGKVIKKRGDKMDYAYSMCNLSKPYLDVIVYIVGAIGTVIWDLICCQKKRKSIVSITEERVYHHSGVKNLINSIDFINLGTTIVAQFGITLALYYVFTGR